MTKHILIILTFLSSWIFAFSQSANTYHIEKLPTPTKTIKEYSQQQVFENLKANKEKSSLTIDSIVYCGEHPFLTGILTAYKEHRPFAISPDIIWVLISQGFARHISNNSEEFRNELVNFSDKKKLIVEVKDITIGKPDNNWEQVFPQFREQISAFTGKELIGVLTADFSTTTPTTEIASQITVMEAMKNYFDYEVLMVGCGIPKITIEGTVEDWEKVLYKTRYLSKYKLEWWTSELEPILKEIINTKKGNFKKQFWMNMVKAHTKKKYGSPTKINGWIVKFFPFDEKGERKDLKHITNIDKLASEIVKVPFVFKDITINKQFEMEFWSGFIGLTQNKTDYTLKPEIAWIVNLK